MDRVLKKDFAALRATCERPRVHGNGFIQLDLDNATRLHIWGHLDIPRQKVRSPIHDHVFSFTSTILVGRMVNIDYVPLPGFDYRVHVPEVREGEDTILRPTRTLTSPHPNRTCLIEEGTSRKTYKMPAFVFHETLTDGPSATVIFKDGLTQAQGGSGLPRVLVPTDLEPDNEFNRYDADPDLLWSIIKEVIERMK